MELELIIGEFVLGKKDETLKDGSRGDDRQKALAELALFFSH